MDKKHKQKFINIRVEPTFAFDLLSIYEIKRDVMAKEDKLKLAQAKEFYNELFKDLEAAFEDDLIDILFSQEYKNLYTANFEIFKCVESVKNGTETRAAVPYELNVLRQRAKIAFQKKIFEHDLMELKT